ncbi:hypothetical protein FQN60_013644, partial [Etheostoma spectabile]
MLGMGFGDDVAAVDAVSSSHFVPLSVMMRNHKVSDRPVPGESRGPEAPVNCRPQCPDFHTSEIKGYQGAFEKGRLNVRGD